jgi:hypothetical protein
MYSCPLHTSGREDFIGLGVTDFDLRKTAFLAVRNRLPTADLSLSEQLLTESERVSVRPVSQDGVRHQSLVLLFGGPAEKRTWPFERVSVRPVSQDGCGINRLYFLSTDLRKRNLAVIEKSCGECWIDTVAEPWGARQFADLVQVLTEQRTVSRVQPRRTAGRPNRPLTALTVEIQSVA